MFLTPPCAPPVGDEVPGPVGPVDATLVLVPRLAAGGAEHHAGHLFVAPVNVPREDVWPEVNGLLALGHGLADAVGDVVGLALEDVQDGVVAEVAAGAVEQEVVGEARVGHAVVGAGSVAPNVVQCGGLVLACDGVRLDAGLHVKASGQDDDIQRHLLSILGDSTILIQLCQAISKQVDILLGKS